MSKQMKSAYSALRFKDTAAAMIGFVKIPVLILAIAMIAMITAGFDDAHALLSIVSCIVSFCCVPRLVMLFCDRRIRHLGFSEIELERLALA